MIHILVSACLLGENCKYSGGNNYHSHFNQFLRENTDKIKVIPVCPEVMGGLKTPRKPAEIVEERVVNQAGEDVTKAFTDGARHALQIGLKYNCQYAVLKERSPSCGSSCIYDGSFQGTVIKGEGITARLLRINGICTASEETYMNLKILEE